MTTALLYLALAVAPDTPQLVATLGAPRFADRERAQRILAGRMCWALAVRLERTSPASPEAARRVARLVDGYWLAALPPPERCPYLDSLSKRNCFGCDRAWTRRYYTRACATGVPAGSPAWLDYRTGTWLLLQDLRRWHVPPAAVHVLLWYMQARSDEWDRSQRQLPIHPTD